MSDHVENQNLLDRIEQLEEKLQAVAVDWSVMVSHCKELEQWNQELGAVANERREMVQKLEAAFLSWEREVYRLEEALREIVAWDNNLTKHPMSIIARRALEGK